MLSGRWRGFGLDPTADRTAEPALPELHHKQMGGTAEQARARIDDVARLARDAELEYRRDITMPVTSFAHTGS